jgi:Pup amidohydrolase
VLDRLLGLETEYAIRFAPSGQRRPTNERIFEAYATAVQGLVATRPGMRERELFLDNGGVIHYEAPPYASEDGLVEGATPECRGPSAALLYQRAQDALLVEATPIAAEALARAGYEGELGLLKNCRDAEGHHYGAQENYEVEIARGLGLAIWRAGIAALLPLIIAGTLLTWALVVGLLAVAIPVVLVAVLAGVVLGERRSAAVARVLFGRPIRRTITLAVWWLERAIWEPIVVGFLLLFRAVAFRRVRRALLPFLVTRPIFTGAGTLDRDRFVLSEKALAARRLCRVSIGPTLAIFDAGNLCKHLTSLSHLELARYLSLFRRKQRLQLGLSDSNMAQCAEYLKVATTSLVIDLALAGALDDLPRLGRPIRTLGRVIRDPDLGFALETQRGYVERAGRFVRAHAAPSLEAIEVVERWSETLDALARDPAELFGCVDWVTKRHLIEGAGQTAAERKKVDLKYHELGTGYFARIESAGLAPMLVTAEEAIAAQREPPPASPARARARVMRELADAAAKVRVSWDRVRVGKRFGGRVIRLDEYR